MSSAQISKSARLARRERGQVAVEFALILPVFIILVAGIIKFGIALNYWLDMQRVANQGARFAAVNAWPTCPRGTTGCKTGSKSLQTYMAASNQKLAKGESWAIHVCLPTDSTGTSGQIGQAVTVNASRTMNLGIPFLPLTIHIKGASTMRLEQAATNIQENPPCN